MEQLSDEDRTLVLQVHQIKLDSRRNPDEDSPTKQLDLRHTELFNPPHPQAAQRWHSYGRIKSTLRQKRASISSLPPLSPLSEIEEHEESMNPGTAKTGTPESSPKRDLQSPNTIHQRPTTRKNSDVGMEEEERVV